MGPQTCQFYKEMYVRGKSLPPGIHFFENIDNSAVHILKSLQRILMKPYIFSKFGEINRAVRLIFLFERKHDRESVTSMKRSVKNTSLQGNTVLILKFTPN